MIAQTEHNTGRTGVADCIGKRLLCNPEHLILQGRSEDAISAANIYFCFQVLRRPLFHQVREPRWQCGLCTVCPEVPYAATGVGEPFPDKLPRAIDLLTCLKYMRPREQVSGELKLRRNGDEPLRQRVMNLTRDACAVREYRVEL
jgi:hypothetical protein